MRHIPRPSNLHKKGGGGVGFYIKNGLKVRTIKHPVSDIEQMWLTLSINSFSFLIGTAYRPRWVKVDSFFDSLTESITSLNRYDYVVLMGDFNINLLNREDSQSKQFFEFIDSVSIINHVTQPTHFTSHSATLIDLISTSIDAPLLRVTVDHIPELGGHSVVCADFKIKKVKSAPKRLTFRPIKNISLERRRFVLYRFI